MSHFCVLVIGDDVDEQLAAYDENLELEMHLVHTKEELIAKEREWIALYDKNVYQKYMADPEMYAGRSDERHVRWLTEEFPKMLHWTDEQCYEESVSGYRNDIAEGYQYCEIHEDGSLWKTTNEKARWDWYVQGGRYRGRLKLKEPNEDAPLYGSNDEENARLKREGCCDQALVKDVSNLDSFVPFAIVKDGEWYERGKMGWWCAVSDEKPLEDWEEEVRKLLKELHGDTLLTVLDCHI